MGFNHLTSVLSLPHSPGRKHVASHICSERGTAAMNASGSLGWLSSPDDPFQA